ncbi:MAG: DNA-binding response regulator [Pseudomonadota bacterium]|nr:DNA-binding response regulator [Pseudomonadota bacterium]
MLNKKILIVEDEPKLAQLLADYLAHDGFESHIIDDGDNVISWVKHYAPDLILMDIMLPKRDGISLCKEIREFSTVPLFLLTARIGETDRLKGLEIGADDYICKPYSAKEVVARIKAIFRRQQNFSPDLPMVSGFSLDKVKCHAYCEGVLLELTLSEFRILSTLLDKRGKVYSRANLLDVLHEDDRDISDRTVDTHIKNLRQKLQKITGKKDIIQAVYGMGYTIE